MESKYAKYAKAFPWKKDTENMKYYAVMDGSYFEWKSMSLIYGLVTGTGELPDDCTKMHTHDYDQIIVFVGSDPDKMYDLGAEVEICLGKEETGRRRFAQPGMISIPAGLPHFSLKVNSIEKPFIYFVLSLSPEMKANILDDNAAPEDFPYMNFYNPNTKFTKPVAFNLHDDFNYGSFESIPSGGMSALITENECGLPLVIGWNVVGLPHPMGPVRPDGRRHAHMHENFDEGLMFMSLDQDDPDELHGELDFAFGDADGGEEQEHVITTKATCMATVNHVWHLPLYFTKVDKPFVFFSFANHGEMRASSLFDGSAGNPTR